MLFAPVTSPLTLALTYAFDLDILGQRIQNLEPKQKKDMVFAPMTLILIQ